MDVEAIMKNSLSRHITEDTHAWAYERNGYYSVRLADRLLKDAQVTISYYSNRKRSLAMVCTINVSRSFV
jgi:hypothetical protein